VSYPGFPVHRHEPGPIRDEGVHNLGFNI